MTVGYRVLRTTVGHRRAPHGGRQQVVLRTRVLTDQRTMAHLIEATTEVYTI
jgi:hypothetical protein